MNTEIKDGQLIITMDLIEPKASKSGKTLLIATTAGFAKTETEFNGKPVSISLNAFIPIS